MAARDRGQRVHRAGDAGVVHRHERAGPLGDGVLDEPLVEVERVLAHVDEHRRRAAQDERVGRRENVNDGMTTSSPGPTSASSAAISSAPVHECVSSTPRGTERSLEPLRAAPENGPLPDRCEASIASRM